MTGRDNPPQLSETAVNAGVSVLLSVMRSKLKFVAFVCAVFIAGLIYAEGFSGTTVLVTIIGVVVVGSFAILVWFWTAILSSFTTNRREH